jgi:hypothetical protein
LHNNNYQQNTNEYGYKSPQYWVSLKNENTNLIGNLIISGKWILW